VEEVVVEKVEEDCTEGGGGMVEDMLGRDGEGERRVPKGCDSSQNWGNSIQRGTQKTVSITSCTLGCTLFSAAPLCG